jgi:hypothetical protein
MHESDLKFKYHGLNKNTVPGNWIDNSWRLIE